jgi:hypothetical protein
MPVVCMCGDTYLPDDDTLREDIRRSTIAFKSAERDFRDAVARLPETRKRHALKEWDEMLGNPVPSPSAFSCRSCSKKLRDQQELNTHLITSAIDKRHSCPVHGLVRVHGKPRPTSGCPICLKRLPSSYRDARAHFRQKHGAYVKLGICSNLISTAGERTLRKGRDSHEVQGGRPESNRRKF